MRTFIVVSCLLAVASAGVLHTPLAYGKSAVFDHNGYKIDDVGPYNAYPVATPFAAPVYAAKTYAAPVVAPVAYAADYKYVGPQHLPVIGPNGVPHDTPEVAAGKAANAVFHAEAHARNGDYAVVAPVAAVAPAVASPVIAARAYAAPLAYAHSHHIPVIGHNGVPLDTPAVAHAKIAHAAAHIEAKALHGELPFVHYRKRRGLVAPIAPVAYAHHAYPQHIPVIGPNGVPLETPEVVAAKISHAAAYADAKVRNGDVAVVAPYAAAYAAPVLAAKSYAAPLAVAAPYYAGYAGPQHLPVIGPNGVPLDTPEVAAGKAANAAFHVEAKARNGDLYHHY